MLNWRRNSDKPNIVPEKIQNPIDLKLIVVIFGVAVAFQIYLYAAFPVPNNASHLIDVISIINPLISSIAAFSVAKKYWGSRVFGKAYLALAIGLAMNFIGETVYGIYDVLGYDTTFTAADIFFYAFYPLIMAHLILNIRFFKPKIGILTKMWVVAIPITITVVYSFLSFQKHGEANFSFYTGLIYVILGSIILSGTMLGTRIFRQGALGVSWLVLLIGVILLTFADVWFSYLDTFDQYTLTHPVNLFWYSGYMIITYALYKHQKII
ncbi:MAG TPA: histidine kinase [Nitrosopumilaceae archaeon]|nr:histidine kinase [Nitrosopumilaceae archaeon]